MGDVEHDGRSAGEAETRRNTQTHSAASFRLLPILGPASPVPVLSSHYGSFLSTPSLLAADVGARGPSMKRGKCGRAALPPSPSSSQAPGGVKATSSTHSGLHVNVRFSHPAAGTGHLLVGPRCHPPARSGGSLAASRAPHSSQVNTASRLQSPRGAETGLQSNVVTRQPRERAGDKSAGSRKRPVLVLEDRL